jgi:hypothetical protein
VQAAYDTPLDPLREPRIKANAIAGEPPKTEHPMFWAGYLLADCGVLAEGQDPPPLASAAEAQQPANGARPAATPAEAPDAANAPAAKPSKSRRTPKSPAVRRAAPATTE